MENFLNGFIYDKSDECYFKKYNETSNTPIHVRVTEKTVNINTWQKENDRVWNKPLNICILFSEDGKISYNSEIEMVLKDESNHIVGIKDTFQILVYIYNKSNLTDNDFIKIYKSIEKIGENKNYIDPFFNNVNKSAKLFLLKPNCFLQKR
jgi:hypothetical protein